MSENAVLLRARDLAARRGGRIVVEHVNLTIERGGLHLLRGANGSGKTTLLRIFASLAPPAAGVLEVDKAQTVFLGHADGVKAALTARENIEFWRKLYEVRDSSDAIAALRISPFLDRRAAGLSAGQRRRLALCRVALSRRPLFLLDEPTSGVDAEGAGAVNDLLTEHCRRGGAAIIATHEPLDFGDCVSIELSQRA